MTSADAMCRIRRSTFRARWIERANSSRKDNHSRTCRCLSALRSQPRQVFPSLEQRSAKRAIFALSWLLLAVHRPPAPRRTCTHKRCRCARVCTPPLANAVATCTPLPAQQQTVFRPPAGRWLALQPSEQRTRGGAAAAACAQRFTLREGSDSDASSPLASAPDDMSFWSDSSSCSSNPGSANSLMGDYYRDPFTWGKLAQAAFDGVHASRHARASLLPDSERGGPWACTVQPSPADSLQSDSDALSPRQFFVAPAHRSSVAAAHAGGSASGGSASVGSLSLHGWRAGRAVGAQPARDVAGRAQHVRWQQRRRQRHRLQHAAAGALCQL